MQGQISTRDDETIIYTIIIIFHFSFDAANYYNIIINKRRELLISCYSRYYNKHFQKLNVHS